MTTLMIDDWKIGYLFNFSFFLTFWSLLFITGTKFDFIMDEWIAT